jgi:hypothetical protein
MAKFLTGGIGITRLSGKVAGHVLNQNGTLRIKAIPKNPRSATQIQQRARLTGQAQGWPGLTANERTAWESAAASGDWKFTDRLGTSFNPTGEQLFVKLNLNIATVGASAITEPPVKVETPIITLQAVTCTAGTPTFTIAYSGTLGTAHTLVVSATSQLSPGRMKAPKAGMRFIQVATGASPMDIEAAYTGLNGSLVAGKKIFYQVEIITEATGQRSFVGGGSVTVGA